MTGYYRDPVPAPVPFWLKPVSILGLLLITTFIESSRLFTIPSIQPLLRLMLADTPSWTWPHDREHMWEVISPHLARYEVGLEPICHLALMHLTLRCYSA